MSDGIGSIDSRAIVGAVLLGVAQFGGTVLLRVGNLASDNPAVNALFFLTPLLALSWLMLEGISVDRFDLFLIGAALIIAINILIQFEPDKETPARQVRKDQPRRYPSRLHSVHTFDLGVRHDRVFAR